jgi:hypothetical protein
MSSLSTGTIAIEGMHRDRGPFYPIEFAFKIPDPFRIRLSGSFPMPVKHRSSAL